jgi:hypothetical protein
MTDINFIERRIFNQQIVGEIHLFKIIEGGG